MPKGQSLSKDAKAMIVHLVHYFERERDANGPLMDLNAVRDRVADALNVSISSVNKAASTAAKGELMSPKHKRQKCNPVTNIDEFDQIAIKNTIYDMYRDKEHVSVSSLLHKLKVKGFTFGRTSLWKILKKIGFKFKKDDPRRGLMELPYIAIKRTEFLRKYAQYKKEGTYNFIYLDETWIFENGTVASSWQDDDIRSVKTLKTGGKRSIILHAGGRDGFVEGAELVFSSKNDHEDYHGEMNRENFILWFRNQLMANLEKPSVIVMDNASYHSTIMNKAPTAANKKEEIQDWLLKNKINFDTNMLKVELVQLVKRHKPPPVFEVDSLAEEHGHKVLRLPPYHCIFNPIENVWGICKTEYNKNVPKEGDTLQKWRNALAVVDKKVWENAIDHAEAEIFRWYQREVSLDNDEIMPIIIHINDSDTDDTDDTDLSE